MSLASQVSALAGAIRDKINTMMPRLLPSGGTANQVLSKVNGTDYNVQWTTLSGGGGPAVIGYAVINFNSPASKKTISVPEVAALTTHYPLITLENIDDAGSDIYAEQMELNPVNFTGEILVDGTINITAYSSSGYPVFGKYAVKYTLI